MTKGATRRYISADPKERLGYYKTLNDVPDRYRLYRFADRYEGEDTWSWWCETHLYPDAESNGTRKHASLAGRRWRSYTDEHGEAEQHALATTGDVDGFCGWLLTEVGMNRRTAHDHYIRFLERFFDDLNWHVDHPHVYNPVLMAAADANPAADFEDARAVWMMKFERPNGRS